MRLAVETPLTIAWLAGAAGRQGLDATFVVKGTFDLEPGAPARFAAEAMPPAGDAPYEGLEGSVRYPSDFAPHKPSAELLLVGAAHAPGGRPVAALKAAVALGSWRKELLVTGARRLKRKWMGMAREMEQPAPFAEQEISYAFAFGGPKYAKNPLGRGAEEIDDPREGRVRDLPRILDPRRPSIEPSDKPDPAGFGAIAPSWPQRAPRGTYDRSWLESRWPDPPRDFDWGIYNAAPADQRFERAFAGDETLTLENLRPDAPRFEARLPGVRPRLFAVRAIDGAPRAEEVELKLDTIWIDAAAPKLVLVWRGRMSIASRRMKDVAAALLFHEDLAAPPSPAGPHFERALALARGEARGVEVEAPEPPEPPSPDQPPDEAWAAEVERAGELVRAELDQAKREIEGERTRLLDAASRGVETRALDASGESGALGGAVSDEEAIAAAEAALRAAAQATPELAPRLAAVLPLPRPRPIEEPRLDDLPRIEAPPTRDEALAALARGEALNGADLSGLDLSGADLAGADLRGASLAGTKLRGARLAKARLDNADLSGADLSGADLEEASLVEADAEGADLSGARLARAKLDGASFARASLAGADLSAAEGKRASFVEARAAELRAAGARLAGADFSAADLEKADFNGAALGEATFERARAAGADFRRADLAKLRASDGADLRGADLRRARGEGAVFEGAAFDGARFEGASLARAMFEDASLKGAKLDGATLRFARFDEAILDEASLTLADLFRASLEGASLLRADLRGASLFEAELWNVRDAGADYAGANLARTKKAVR